MIPFLIASLVSLVVIVLVTLLHYEFMRTMSDTLENPHRRHRYFSVFIVISLFLVHTVSIWIYGIVYWLLETRFSFGELHGLQQVDFISFIYFSASTYSSLGFGDIFPVGPLRLIASAEVLQGLLLIGWSVAFTFFMMQKLWDKK